MKLLFCSQNEHKKKEIQQKLSQKFEVVNLKDLSYFEDIPETADSFEGNAQLKAETIYNQFGIPCFADDSGLVVPSLNGEPGIFSARYAGPEKKDQANMDLLLQKLTPEKDHSAYFVTVICLIVEYKPHFFKGKIHGTIIHEKRGTDGFGYDPIFIPNGFDRTFAEMSLTEKNQLSHRSIAIEKMLSFLNSDIK